MEQNHDNMCKSYWKQGKKEPLICTSCSLEKLSRAFASEVIELMYAKKSSGTEISPRVIALEAKCSPEVVF